MHSKKSKSRRPQFRLWKAEQNCSETRLAVLAKELAVLLASGDRVLLEGEMGAGKTTFARQLIASLGVVQPPEGSPTFAIAHEYDSPLPLKDGVVHIDFFRLKSEAEIDDAGIPAYFWERHLIVICEWLSLFPEFEHQVVAQANKAAEGGRSIWKIRLEIQSENLRNVTIETSKI